jgi:predicted phosphodiesterase
MIFIFLMGKRKKMEFNLDDLDKALEGYGIFSDDDDDEEVHMECITALVIGDIHFMKNRVLEDQEFIRRCVIAANTEQPTFIVLLGDILDQFETVKTDPRKSMEVLIDKLSRIAPTYVLVGNHDYINNQQFCTQNHQMNALKKWRDVYIIDYPTVVDYGDYTFFMCPYSPDGRFYDMLELLSKKGYEWRNMTCGFSHQKFNGCTMGSQIMEDGDDWSEDQPPIINGHHHDEQIVNGVHIPGSSTQHKYDDRGGKRIWKVTFGDTSEYPYFSIKRINLGLREKRIIHHTVEDVSLFDFTKPQQYDIKIKLKGSPEELRLFRKTPIYDKLLNAKVRIDFTVQNTEHRAKYDYISANRETTSFENVLNELIILKSPAARDALIELKTGMKKKEVIAIVGDDYHKLRVKDIVYKCQHPDSSDDEDNEEAYEEEEENGEEEAYEEEENGEEEDDGEEEEGYDEEDDDEEEEGYDEEDDDEEEEGYDEEDDGEEEGYEEE